MCDFFSGILTKDGKVLYDLDLDNHAALIEKFGLKDDKPPELRSWIKFEITPKDENVFNKRKSNWIFRQDEDKKAEWLSDRMMRNAFAALNICLKERVIIKNTKKVINGRWFVGGSAVVEYVGGSAVVEYVGGSAVVKTVRGSAVVEYVVGSAVVEYVRGSAVVKSVGGSAVVKSVGDSAVVKIVRGSAVVESVGGSAVVEYVGGSAVVLSHNPRVIRVAKDSNATLQKG